jgi:hypothetical protein
MVINDTHLSVLIGDEQKQWPDRGAGIPQCTIFVRAAYALPCIKLVLQDEGNNVGSQFIFNDGDIITVRWGYGNNVFTNQFRIGNIRMEPVNNTYFYTIYGWLDNVKWMAEQNNKSYKGTSSEVIGKLGQECGLKVVADKTTDSQTWLGCSETNHTFANRIAKRGYGGKDSLMSLSVGLEALHYRDINAIDFGKPVCAFQLGQGITSTAKLFGNSITSFPMTTCRVENHSGSFNLAMGYKSSRMDANIEDRSKAKAAESAPVKLKTDQMSHNNKIKNEITTPKADFSTPRSDNTHENYNAAEYQNRRGVQQLLNARVDFTSPAYTGLSLYDPIWAVLSGSNMGVTGSVNNMSSMYDGPYMVTGRVIHISGGTYTERLTVTREGITSHK